MVPAICTDYFASANYPNVDGQALCFTTNENIHCEHPKTGDTIPHTCDYHDSFLFDIFPHFAFTNTYFIWDSIFDEVYSEPPKLYIDTEHLSDHNSNNHFYFRPKQTRNIAFSAIGDWHLATLHMENMIITTDPWGGTPGYRCFLGAFGRPKWPLGAHWASFGRLFFPPKF